MTRLKPLLVLLGAIPVLATLFVVAAPAAHAVATDTSVMIIPPGLGTVNSYNTLTASVTAQDGVTAPVGSIQFRTAAGRGIKWRVITGAANCTITSGAHFARVRVLGPCTISGSAPKVLGLWAPFEVTQILAPRVRAESGN